MSESAPLILPPETVRDIVFMLTILYIEDLVVGPLSLRAEQDIVTLAQSLGLDLNFNPVEALPVSSMQLRHFTLEALSGILGIPLCKDGLWRLEGKPYTKIAPVRRWCAAAERYTRSGSPDYDHAALALRGCAGSSMLRVYTLVFLANAFRPLVRHRAGLGQPHAGVLFTNMPSVDDLEALNAQIDAAYADTHEIFQRLHLPVWRAHLIETALFHTYDIHYGMIKFARHRAEMIALRKKNPRAPDMPPEEPLEPVEGILRTVQEADTRVHETWAHSLSFNAAFGAPRLKAWSELLTWLIGCEGDTLEERMAAPRDSSHRSEQDIVDNK
ncbi:hypothetical protein PsYK624_132390 [Phanerochaete sordida]|uniref:Uncharacterized protein n=1 Tax=Phanerochaete sordida TaxID=48140 RepID=A0A9P3LJU2_9APHY|nr:hypothetical protein PsYK624_132390 [Phanerochaete sordida]